MANGKDEHGRFTPGNGGRPKGALGRYTRLRAAADGHGGEGELTPLAYLLSLVNDTSKTDSARLAAASAAAPYIHSRPAQVRRAAEPFRFEPPSSASEVSVILARLAEATAGGLIDIDTAATIADILKLHLVAFGGVELENRLKQIETAAQ